ncbi:putative cold-regulated 413 protein [Medicago truncatula]|uniref:Cold acclimation protein WCOR413 n=1 Tax=Medicago truncatula TaxID=3880 RepID=A0A072VH55_MEDTR|nr:cold-regulated 413 plasma membrane protein 1 [Medicago truncatula]KEH40768.1 cold acclimation protein WCOR413 [Medicago truncatula]RHN78173.1 putative cold-regulated 413 protein [Medicago truncatula]
MRIDFEDEAAAQLITSDLTDLALAANNFILLGVSGSGISVLQLIASIAAIYLLILDRTNWKTNIFTSLLIPYIFLSLPSWIFSIFRAEIGRWIALIAVVLRLFFPRHFPDWLELPAALILLIVVAPDLFANTFRSDAVGGVVVCLIIACYLLQEHIRASGGFRDSFTKAYGMSNTIGIILLLIYPIWTLVLYITT